MYTEGGILDLRVLRAQIARGGAQVFVCLFLFLF